MHHHISCCIDLLTSGRSPPSRGSNRGVDLFSIGLIADKMSVFVAVVALIIIVGLSLWPIVEATSTTASAMASLVALATTNSIATTSSSSTVSATTIRDMSSSPTTVSASSSSSWWIPTHAAPADRIGVIPHATVGAAVVGGVGDIPILTVAVDGGEDILGRGFLSTRISELDIGARGFLKAVLVKGLTVAV